MPKKRETKITKAKPKSKKAHLPLDGDGVLLTPEMTGLPMNIFVSRKPKKAKGEEPFLLVESRQGPR